LDQEDYQSSCGCSHRAENDAIRRRGLIALECDDHENDAADGGPEYYLPSFGK
jgi:hypothetical protein